MNSGPYFYPMVKNQKACPTTDRYRKEEKYLNMELWQGNDLSQGKFCSPENLSANHSVTGIENTRM
jgi:hypothetical protein